MGFTLAEVLITLGIIGIVAAMTIPSLIYKYQIKHLESQFKKTYSTLNQMAKLYYEENGETISDANSYTIYGYSQNMGKIMMRYIKGLSIVHKTNFSTTDEDGNHNIKRYYNFKGQKNHPLCDYSYTYTDLNGVHYSYDDPSGSGLNGPTICVDLNGDAGPNTYGIDYFSFIATIDGTIVPMGEVLNGTTWHYYDSSNCKPKMATPYSCAYWAARNQSPTGVGTYWDDFIGKKLYKK